MIIRLAAAGLTTLGLALGTYTALPQNDAQAAAGYVQLRAATAETPSPMPKTEHDAPEGPQLFDGGGQHVQTRGKDLTVRRGASTTAEEAHRLPNGAPVSIICQTEGDEVSGYYGTTKIWNKIGENEFISDAYTYTGSDGRVAPDCNDTPPAPPSEPSHLTREWGTTYTGNPYGQDSPEHFAQERFHETSGYYLYTPRGMTDWDNDASAHGWTVTDRPEPGAIVVFENGVHGTAPESGWVGWVDEVRSTPGQPLRVTLRDNTGVLELDHVEGMHYILAPTP